MKKHTILLLAGLALAQVHCTQKSTLSSFITNSGSSASSSPGNGSTPPTSTPPPSTPPPVITNPTNHTTQTKLSVPSKISSGGHQNDPLIYAGYLDVTLYGADPTGKNDSTAAFQNALVDASGDSASQLYGTSLVVYVPPGTYKVSNTITGYQGCNSNATVTGNAKFGTVAGNGGFGTSGQGYSAPSLVGPASSTAASRPTIILQDNTFTDPSNPKPLIHFVNTPNGNPSSCNGQWWKTSAIGAYDILFNAVIRDINIKLGNNPGAIGIQFYSAQFSYMQNVTVNAAGGHIGIQGSPSTDLWTNLEVNGGDYGLWMDAVAGAPAVAGLKLENQTTAGIYYNSVGGLALTGFDIEESSGVGITTRTAVAQGGQISLVDGIISTASGVAIQNRGDDSVYINNVYVKTPLNIIENTNSTSVSGNGQFQLINEYSHADQNTNSTTMCKNGQPSGCNPGYALSCNLVIDDKPQKNDYGPVYGSGTPPTDFIARHIPGQMPWAFDSNVYWITDFGADPTGAKDSTAAIRNAVASAHANGSDKVFMPRGNYLISGTIVLYPATKLFGIPAGYARFFTTTWNPGTKITPFLQVGNALSDAAGSSAGTAVVSDISFLLPSVASSTVSSDAFSYLTAIDWQTGRRSIMSQVFIAFPYSQGLSTSAARSLIYVHDTGGGRFYGIQMMTDYGPVGPNGYQLQVANTTTPLTFYGPNLEHGFGKGVFGFNNSSNIRVFGSKTEIDIPWFYSSNSDNIMVSAATSHGIGTYFVNTNSTRVNINTAAYFAATPSSTPLITDDATKYPATSTYSLFKLQQFDNSVFPRCGDGYCDNGESTLTCAADCK